MKLPGRRHYGTGADFFSWQIIEQLLQDVFFQMFLDALMALFVS